MKKNDIPKWEDDTSYSRSETNRVPAVWGLKTKTMRISVHRHIHYPPDMWLCSCGLFDKLALESKDIDAAKAEALRKVHEVLTEMLKDITKVTTLL